MKILSASVKPIDKTIINKIKTYLGALDVTEKILLGSKYFIIIFILYFKSKIRNINVKNYLIKNVEGDNNEG